MPRIAQTSSIDAPNAAPIALTADEGEALWFIGSLATIKASGQKTSGRVAVIEHLSPRGSGSPLHVHHREDEWFYIVEGELTIWVGGELINASAGSFVYGPRDVPHTYTVSSDTARFLVVVEPAGFDNFIRTLAQPAPEREIPPPETEPTDVEALMCAAAKHGIEILGPPGIPS